MKFYQDDDWLEEEPEEVYDDGIEYLYDDDEAEASDQILLDQDSLRRMDSEWERRERYHEILQEEYIPGGEEFYSGRIFPAALDAPESKLILRGIFLDLFFNCPYEMHQLTADPFLSRIVDELSDLHKETLYLLSLQYLSTSQLAHMRDQSDRNIRKLRDNYTKKLQKQLYGHLFKKIQQGQSLTFREREFLGLYETALNNGDDTKVKVKRENNYPKRMRKSGTASSTSTEIGVAV